MAHARDPTSKAVSGPYINAQCHANSCPLPPVSAQLQPPSPQTSTLSPASVPKCLRLPQPHLRRRACCSRADTTQLCYASIGRAGRGYVSLKPFWDTVSQTRALSMGASWGHGVEYLWEESCIVATMEGTRNRGITRVFLVGWLSLLSSWIAN